MTWHVIFPHMTWVLLNAVFTPELLKYNLYSLPLHSLWWLFTWNSSASKNEPPWELAPHPQSALISSWVSEAFLISINNNTAFPSVTKSCKRNSMKHLKSSFAVRCWAFIKCLWSKHGHQGFRNIKELQRNLKGTNSSAVINITYTYFT